MKSDKVKSDMRYLYFCIFLLFFEAQLCPRLYLNLGVVDREWVLCLHPQMSLPLYES